MIDEHELAARRAAVKAMAAVCPMCGRSLKDHGGTYAQDAETDEPPVDDAPPSNWRSLPPLA